MFRKYLCVLTFAAALFICGADAQAIEAADVFAALEQSQGDVSGGTRVLYSLDESPDFEITYHQSGFTISLRGTNTICEFSPDGADPYAGVDNGYYAGPLSFLYKNENGRFVDIRSGIVLNNTDVERLLEAVYLFKQSAQSQSISVFSSSVLSSPMSEYVKDYQVFDNMYFGTGTCGPLAASVLLTYYAKTVDPNFVPDDLMPKKEKDNKLYLKIKSLRKVLPDSVIFEISAMTNRYIQARKTLGYYAEWQATFTYINPAFIKDKIQNDTPCIIGAPFGTFIQDNGHAMVAYGYDPLTGLYAAHTVLYPESGHSTFEAINQTWINQAMWLAKAPSTIAVGKSVAFSKYAPAKDKKDVITWQSSNTAVATVNKSGSVKAVRTGIVTITMKNTTKNTQTSWNIECFTPIKSIKIAKLTKEEKTLTVNTDGGSATKRNLSCAYLPIDASYDPVWVSTNPHGGYIQDDGTVTAFMAGTTFIYAYDPYTGKKASVTLNVRYNPDGIRLTAKDKVGLVDVTAKTLSVKKTYKPTVTFVVSTEFDKNALKYLDPNAKKNLTWTSSNNNVATVDKNGKITGVSPGTAVITVKTKNNKTASVTITVT